MSDEESLPLLSFKFDSSHGDVYHEVFELLDESIYLLENGDYEKVKDKIADNVEELLFEYKDDLHGAIQPEVHRWSSEILMGGVPERERVEKALDEIYSEVERAYSVRDTSMFEEVPENVEYNPDIIDNNLEDIEIDEEERK